MQYLSTHMEEQAVLNTAAQMCASARTAPKAKGIDDIITLVLTGEDKTALAEKIREIGLRDWGEGKDAWFSRDSRCLDRAQAVVLIGVRKNYRGIQNCGFCGHTDCADCKESHGSCFMAAMDLGIAISSACTVAAGQHIDNRIMFSIGRAAMEMDYGYENVIWQGIPLSVSGKNIFFDR